MECHIDSESHDSDVPESELRIGQLVWDSNIPLSPNVTEVNSCAEHLLLMLEVERREEGMLTESKSHRCRVVCEQPYAKLSFPTQEILSVTEFL